MYLSGKWKQNFNESELFSIGVIPFREGKAQKPKSCGRKRGGGFPLSATNYFFFLKGENDEECFKT